MKREVVLTRTSIVTAVGFVAYMAARLGYLGFTPAVQDQVVTVLSVSLPVVLPLLAALWARLGVTPTYDPKATASVPLVPAPSLLHPSDEANLDVLNALAHLDDHSSDPAPATPEV
jgi:hypothetical protein